MKLLIKNLLPFFVLLFVVMGCSTKLGRQPKERLDEQRRVVEQLNDKFDLSKDLYFGSKGNRIQYDCKFKFWLKEEDDKITLVAYFCESTSSATKERKLTEVLTPENAAMIKNAGFEQVKLYERVTYELVDRVDIR